MRIASALVLLMACGGRAKDETRLLLPVPDRVEAQQTSIGAAQPAPGALASPPASESGARASKVPASAEPLALPVEPEPTARIPQLACEPGAARCNGALAEQCSPGDTWELREQCGECNGRSTCEVLGEVAACLPPICCFPQTRCNGQFLQICNADATGFELLQDCGSPGLCDSIRGACLASCVPGRTRCNGSELERCNNDGTGFDNIAYCATPALCELGQQLGTCATGCAPGEARCSGSTLMRCNEGQTGYEIVEVCPSACDPGIGCVSADAGVDF
jgi:hypothetical protein